MSPMFHKTSLRGFQLGAAMFAFASIAAAQSQTTDIRPDANRILGEQLPAEYSGVTHKGAYNFTDAGDPSRFYTETTTADGKTSYSEIGVQSEGQWSVKQDMLCFDYDNEAMAGGCFRVYRVGNCFYYYSDSLALRRDELDRDYWTARSVKRGEAPNCEPGVS